jgi:hypothetical protein
MVIAHVDGEGSGVFAGELALFLTRDNDSTRLPFNIVGNGCDGRVDRHSKSSTAPAMPLLYRVKTLIWAGDYKAFRRMSLFYIQGFGGVFCSA